MGKSGEGLNMEKTLLVHVLCRTDLVLSILAVVTSGSLFWQ